MRVHVIQLAYGDDETLAERVDRVAAILRSQHGADLVVLPELWPNGGFAYEGWEATAQPLDGPIVTALRAATRELGALVHMGSLVERDDTGRLFNTSVLLGRDGDILATYRKIHLFGFGEGEPKLMTPGDSVVVYNTLGLATCYDLRFPEQFRLLLDAGAEVVVIPAAWPAKRVAHWRLLAQARAVENQSYVVAANTIVVDPWGNVLAEAGTSEEVLVVDLDLPAVARTRSAFPILADRRL
jgi:predicted amidohydrolase